MVNLLQRSYVRIKMPAFLHWLWTDLGDWVSLKCFVIWISCSAFIVLLPANIFGIAVQSKALKEQDK